MATDRFAELARELALRDRDLAARLERARARAAALREWAEHALQGFRDVARDAGAAHLAHVEVGPVEPDEKHVDCVQFKVERGRWEITCVAKSAGKVTLVGPYKKGKPEKPCHDHPLVGGETEQALEDLLVDLLRQASDRTRAKPGGGQEGGG